MLAGTAADLLGVSMKGLRLILKNAAPDLVYGVKPDSILEAPVVVAVLLEMGLAACDVQGCIVGVGGFDVAGFAQKGRAAMLSARGGPFPAVVTGAQDVILEKPRAAAHRVTGVALLVSACPNPLFWRAKLAGRMVTVKEPLAQKRARFRPGLTVKVWPLEFPADHFTTVEPKGGA